MSSSRLETSRRSHQWTIALVGALGLVGAWRLWGAHAGQELRELPAAERKALYSRTLETLESTCTRAARKSLGDYCRDQAEFALHFPECEATCRRLAHRYAPRSVR